MNKLILTIVFVCVGMVLCAQVDKPVVDNEKNIIFEKVETSPEFPGGLQAWRKFVTDSLRPEIPADNGAPAGAFTVVVQFIVQKDGKVTEIKALTSHGYGMEEEAMRLIRASPPWVPAKQNGRIVRAYMKQPITFVITEE